MKLSDLVNSLVAVINEYGDLEISSTYEKCGVKKSEDDAAVPVTLKMELYISDFDADDDYRIFKKFMTRRNAYGNYTLTFEIDIATGVIKDWVKKTGGIPGNFFNKQVDCGTYSLYGENGELIESYTGYVPNKLVPEKDGYGDYIDLIINEEGKITNWYKEPSFKDFYREDDDE
jgi:hypothetical protein